MRKAVGRYGEGLAVEYLQGKGYHILEQNYRSRYGELDIICTKDADLIFVEVKTRRSSRFGTAAESITYRKQQHLKSTALHYLKQLDKPYRSIRFDVISVMITPAPVINHIQGAF